MKACTKEYSPKKAPTITHDKLMHLVKDLLDEEIPVDLLHKVIILLMYYGLLHPEEVLKIMKEDINMESNENYIEINFPYSSKTQLNGFSYLIPGQFKPTFHKYLSMFDNNEKFDSVRFIRNYNVRKKKFLQPAGEKVLQ